MKLCMLTSSYPRHAGDGAGSFVASLARALVSLGHEVHVIAPYDPAVAPMDQGGVCVHRFRYAPTRNLHLAGHGRALQADRQMKAIVPLLMPAFVISATGRALALHRQEHFDCLHAHWAVPGAAIGGLVARLTKLPLVVSLHGSDVYVVERNGLYAAAARSGFRRAARVAACSADLQQRTLAVGLATTRSAVIPYGVDLAPYAAGNGQRMRATLGIPDTALVIGALGRLVHKKGFVGLIAAMPDVIRQVPNACAVIGGEGDLADALQSQARELGLGERVRFAGPIDWRATPDFYSMCDCFTVPSVIDAGGNVDGLPNVLLEAMASGCPIVASRVGGIPDVLTDEVHGLLVPPGDVQALSAALARLASDIAGRRRLGEAARQLVAAQYTWESIARQYEQTYRAAIAGRQEQS